MSREVPMCLPVLRALTKTSSVQTPPPNPVLASGVRFAAKETPQGPLQEVSESLVAMVHGLPAPGWYRRRDLDVLGMTRQHPVHVGHWPCRTELLRSVAVVAAADSNENPTALDRGLRPGRSGRWCGGWLVAASAHHRHRKANDRGDL